MGFRCTPITLSEIHTYVEPIVDRWRIMHNIIIENEGNIVSDCGDKKTILAREFPTNCQVKVHRAPSQFQEVASCYASLRGEQTHNCLQQGLIEKVWQQQ